MSYDITPRELARRERHGIHARSCGTRATTR